MYNGFNWSDFSKRVFNTLLTMFFGFLMHLEQKQQFNNISLLKKKNYNRLDFQLLICLIITWPIRPRAQFPWKTIREKVLYEGRTRRSDRAGKTRTALLEMRTALLETPTAKSMQVNFVLSNMWVVKVNILRANFTIQANWTTSVVLTPKAKKETYHSSQMKKLTTFPEANKQTGSQGNNFSG